VPLPLPPPPRFFETFSYLPPLTDAEVLKQVQYLLRNNWTPCVEFEFPSTAYAKSGMLEGMDSSASAGYYVNRYWSMWKLPMYGATDADSVLAECKKAAKAFPGAFIRLVGFDAERQARCALRCAAHRLRARLRRRQPVKPLLGSRKKRG
jgi:ribulose-bisphosphate carboxylase small chain